MNWKCLAILPALLLLLGVAWAENTVYDDNVVVVLDASGSMDERMPHTSITKMEAAKSAIFEVLKQVPKTTNIGILVFSASNVRQGEEWLYPLGKREDERLRGAINHPQPSEGTPLGTYIKKAADRLLQEREKQLGYGTYRLLIVTDGQANSEPEDYVDRFTLDTISRGIVVDVIGVNMDKDHSLAKKVHSYKRADDPAALQKAVAEVFAEVSVKPGSDTSEDVFAVIKPLPDELASAIIMKLAEGSGNQQIGEKPKPKPVATVPANVTDNAAASSQAGMADADDSATTSSNQTGSGLPWGWIILGIVIVLFILIIILAGRSCGGGY